MTDIDDRDRPSLARRSVGGAGRVAAGTFRFLAKSLLVLAFIAAGLFAGGFLQFANSVTSADMPADPPKADGIVVLTGGSARIAKALDLLASDKAQRLLISGVNPATRQKDIEAINPSRRELFSCCVDLEKRAQDTVGNAEESARWLKEKSYESVILVTSNYHMPRSLIEFQRRLGDVKIIPYPVRLADLDDQDWWRKPQTLRFMLSEYIKYIGAKSRDYLNADTINSVRSTVLGI